MRLVITRGDGNAAATRCKRSRHAHVLAVLDGDCMLVHERSAQDQTDQTDQTDGEEVTTSSELFACAELPAKVVPAFPCTSPPVWCIISISSACSLLTTAPCCGRLGSDARRPTVGRPRPPGHQGTSAAALHSTRMRRAARWGLETSTVARSQPFTQSQSPTVAQSHLAQHS